MIKAPTFIKSKFLIADARIDRVVYAKQSSPFIPLKNSVLSALSQ